MTEIEVLAAGPLTTFQDLGRPGFAHLGVPPSGAVDSNALGLGNWLVGNPFGAAALEATLVGPRLRFHAPTLVALTGAESALGLNVIVHVGPDEDLDVGPCRGGARIYVCVHGGFEVPLVLGSRSTDLLTGIGPRPLRDGDILTIGPPPAVLPRGEVVPVAPPSGPKTLRVLLGPRDEWLRRDDLDTLFAARWTVTNAANRIGVRLDGPNLGCARQDTLPSEGLVTGALQLPSSGKPILLLNDHPTTGGYPAFGVVDSRDLPLAGQLRPGDTVGFSSE